MRKKVQKFVIKRILLSILLEFDRRDGLKCRYVFARTARSRVDRTDHSFGHL